MNRTTIPAALFAVLALGASAPGCYPPDNTIGSFCASPAEGGEFCVSVNQSPFAAWNQAKLHGSLPIQMWAKWPDGMSLDEVIESEHKLKVWFADVDTVLAYVRNKQKCAECYKASMEGNLGALLKQAKARQAEIIAEKPADAIGHFQYALTEKATAEKNSTMAVLATDKQSMAAVQGVFDTAKSEAALLSTTYAGIVKDFTAYRATEEAETATYTSLAQQGSRSTLATLPAVEQAVLVAARDASSKPSDLALAAMELSASIQRLELAYPAALAPYRDFMATHGAAMPDMTSSGLRSLNAMLGYIQQRVTRSDATATSLLNNLAMRKQALVLLNAGQPLRDQVAQAEFSKAGAVFSAEASARVTSLTATPPMSATMNLPYLAARYDELTRFVQLEPLCDPSSSSWREAGCTALRPNFTVAKTYLKTTLPALITTGLSTMRSTGMDTMLLNTAQVRLSMGDVKGAAIAYDAAIRSTEGT